MHDDVTRVMSLTLFAPNPRLGFLVPKGGQ